MTLIEARDEIMKRLTVQQKRRSKFTEDVTKDGETHIGWVFAERDCVLTAVNKLRAALGKEPVSAKDIRRIDNMAAGHSDYTSKFCLYAAEMVMAGIK